MADQEEEVVPQEVETAENVVETQEGDTNQNQSDEVENGEAVEAQASIENLEAEQAVVDQIEAENAEVEKTQGDNVEAEAGEGEKIEAEQSEVEKEVDEQAEPQPLMQTELTREEEPIEKALEEKDRNQSTSANEDSNEHEAPQTPAAEVDEMPQEKSEDDKTPDEDTPIEVPVQPSAEEHEKETEEIGPEKEEQREEPVVEESERQPVEEPLAVSTEAPTLASEPPVEPITETKPNMNLDATATVKFVLMPSGQVVTLACTLGQTLDSLKSHFATELKMSVGLIMLMFDGKSMPDAMTLADLGVGPNGTIQLEMQSADPVNTPLKSYRPRQEYHMPDVITVRVQTDDCEAKDVVVEIERSRCKKPFLGGFRNKNSGIEFHNASAQTMQKPRPPTTTERFCRDTQTCEQRNTRQQTMNTTSTQMTGIGVYVANMDDKLMTPGKYTSAEEYHVMVLKQVIVLQKYYRRWLAKRYVKTLAVDKARRLEWERQEEIRKKKEKEERIKRDYERRINPKTKGDFDMLVHCLEKWRQEEMERINANLEGAERKAAMCMLFDQETDLLSAIERHKNDANIDNREKRIASFLEKAAAPKKWQGHDGKMTYMDTPYTIRAKELRDIYNSINMKYLTQDERLDVLLTLKHTVKEHDCKLTREIIELIDREADLLMRGVKEGNLTGLRKRISTLFLQYTKTPTFNPEAAKLLKVPQDPSCLRKNINYCHSCGNYKPSTEFYITSNSRQVGRCRQCQKIENDGRQREDHTYFKAMLRTLRRSEESMQDGSSICFLIKEPDLRYLVENIWSNQSILSAWDDQYDLVSVRWDKHKEWSPWNCVLLTHDEAEAHKKLFSLEEGYGAVFQHKVTQKHNFARNYFSRLPGMSELLREKLSKNETGPAVAGPAVPVAGATQKV